MQFQLLCYEALNQLAQGPIQHEPWPWTLPGIYNFSGQSGPVSHHPHWKECLHIIKSKPTLFQFQLFLFTQSVGHTVWTHTHLYQGEPGLFNLSCRRKGVRKLCDCALQSPHCSCHPWAQGFNRVQRKQWMRQGCLSRLQDLSGDYGDVVPTLLLGQIFKSEAETHFFLS